ncbi:MAG TPA: hypothetical protein VF962_05115 [Gemmatimonadaceae bacterium]
MAKVVKRVKRFLFGRPLPSERLEHERHKKTALAVLSSDAISSVAYAIGHAYRLRDLIEHDDQIGEEVPERLEVGVAERLEESAARRVEAA